MVTNSLGKTINNGSESWYLSYSSAPVSTFLLGFTGLGPAFLNRNTMRMDTGREIKLLATLTNTC